MTEPGPISVATVKIAPFSDNSLFLLFLSDAGAFFQIFLSSPQAVFGYDPLPTYPP